MADQNAWVKITEYERHGYSKIDKKNFVLCESMVDREKQSYTYCNHSY